MTWYRTLFGESALGMSVTDGQRRVIDCNDAFCRILGRNREDVLGRRFTEFNVPGDADVGGAALETVIAGAPALSYEKRYLRADGRTTWVRINLTVLSREDDLYAGIIEDIDERKEAEAARELALAQLREKTDLLARAHEVAKLGTFAIDSRSRTMHVSAELARMLAAKHGGTRAQVTLSLKRREGALELEITDDGPGFDPLEHAHGYGLASMRDRVAGVGGELEILSAPGQGARICATVPTAAG